MNTAPYVVAPLLVIGLHTPGYVDTLLFVLAYALFANYLTTYILLLLTIPTLYVIVIWRTRSSESASERNTRTIVGGAAIHSAALASYIVSRRSQ